MEIPFDDLHKKPVKNLFTPYLPESISIDDDMHAMLIQLFSFFNFFTQTTWTSLNAVELYTSIGGKYPRIPYKKRKEILEDLKAKNLIVFGSEGLVVNPEYRYAIMKNSVKNPKLKHLISHLTNNIRYHESGDVLGNYCIVSGSKQFGYFELEFFTYWSSEQQLSRLLNLTGDFTLFDRPIVKNLHDDKFNQLLQFCLRRIGGSEATYSKALEWFKSSNKESQWRSYFSLISTFSLEANPCDIRLLAAEMAEGLNPEFKGVGSFDFVADILDGNYDVAYAKAVETHQFYNMLNGNKKKELPWSMGLFMALLLLKKDREKGAKMAMTFVNAGIRNYKKVYSGFDEEIELHKLFLHYCGYVKNKGKFNHSLTENSALLSAWYCLFSLWSSTENRSEITGIGAIVKNHPRSALEILVVLERDFEENQITAWIEQLKEKTGIKVPIEGMFQPEEKWEKLLDYMDSVVSEEPVVRVEKKNRLIWCVNFMYKDINPVLQTKQKNGWSKGRNVALKTLFRGSPDYATAQDLAIINHIELYSDWGRLTYILNFNLAILELVDHPLVFSSDEERFPITIDAVYAELKIQKTNIGQTVSFTYDPEVHFVKNSKSHYSVIKWKHELHQIALKFAENEVTKLSIPHTAAKESAAVFTKLSQKVDIRGDFEDPNMIKIKGDRTMVVRLQPFSGVLNARFLIKPMADSDVTLIPGKGSAQTLHRTRTNEKVQIQRVLKKEVQLLDEIKNEIPALAVMDGHEIDFEMEHDILDFLSQMKEFRPKIELMWPKGEQFKITRVLKMSDFNFNIKSRANWFGLDGEIQVDKDKMWSILELLSASDSGSTQFVKLDGQSYLKLTRSLQKQLASLSAISQAADDKLNVHQLGAPVLEGLIQDAGKLKADKIWKENKKKREALRAFTPELPANLQGELRPYQKEGYDWLERLYTWGVGACLADDMGLGKTIQAIALLLKHAGNGPSVVVAPSSVCSNWHKEVLRFSPTLRTHELPQKNRQQKIDELKAFDILIVSYGLLQSNTELLKNKKWNIAVLDEAHAIKNQKSKRSKAVMNISAEFQLLTTGTPIQNHVGEIWNLFQFINPGFLGSFDQFTSRFIDGQNDQDTRNKRKALNQLIQPFILRRNKADVLDDLPSKTDITLTIEQTSDEKALYEAMRLQAVAEVEDAKNAGETVHMEILARISKLRLASCNPQLVYGGENMESSKMAALQELIDNLLNANHKALIFSQFTKHLALIRQMLDAQGVRYQYLDGSTSLKNRDKEIHDFQSGKSELFLISLKAGGVGLNLTAADYVIHMDPWWNPAVEDQASDRAHRIGQTRPVTVYRLVAEGTIEEKIVQLHHSKRDMASQLMADTDKSAKISSDQLFALMR